MQLLIMLCTEVHIDFLLQGPWSSWCTAIQNVDVKSTHRTPIQCSRHECLAKGHMLFVLTPLPHVVDWALMAPGPRTVLAFSIDPQVHVLPNANCAFWAGYNRTRTQRTQCPWYRPSKNTAPIRTTDFLVVMLSVGLFL